MMRLASIRRSELRRRSSSLRLRLRSRANRRRSARPVMAPTMPSPSTAHSASMSSRLDRPPEAITGMRQRLRQLHGGFDVDAGQHAVAADVGVDDRLRRRSPRTSCARSTTSWPVSLRPAVGRHLAVLGVQADDDVAGEGGAGVVQETGVLDRRGADDDVAQAVVEVALDGVEVADAAAQLHRNLVADFLEDGLDRRFVLRLAGEGAVQVDQMQAARALVDPVPGHVGRVCRKTRWPVPSRPA